MPTAPVQKLPPSLEALHSQADPLVDVARNLHCWPYRETSVLCLTASRLAEVFWATTLQLLPHAASIRYLQPQTPSAESAYAVASLSVAIPLDILGITQLVLQYA